MNFYRVGNAGAVGLFRSFVFLALLIVSLPGNTAADTVTFSYTGSNQTWIVPSGVTSITVKLWGAGGGSTNNTSPNADYGGAGAFVTGILAVTPGNTLAVVVGQGGSVDGVATYGGGGAAGVDTNTHPGGGGGYSGIFLTSVSFSNALAVASGGGGSSNTSDNARSGGRGGATTGQDGAGSFPGHGATQSAGGTNAGGTTNSSAGSQLTGGKGHDGASRGGGGGGGGYYGGGGGGNSSNVGGGGGGSSYLGSMTSTATTESSDGYSAPNTADANYPGGSIAAGGLQNSSGGNGYVVITYTPSVPFTHTTITLTKSSTVTGNANVVGAISKGSGTFAIDHPLDPKNWILYHSFVESPEAMNIYDGIATLDKDGEATVELPRYFLALNKDFRYLGTAIGEPMPNLFLAKGVQHRVFGLFGKPVVKISGGAPNGRISWQVTGVRKDPFILAHPIIVEVLKGPDQPVDKGKYLFSEFYTN